MKKRVTWKIVASLCLIALILPTFSGLSSTPVVAEDGSTPTAPPPYALDFVGQEHPSMYKTAADVTIDGIKNDNEDYVLLTEKTDGDNNSSGIFSSAGSIEGIRDPASEARPKYFRVYGNYDEEGLNLYIEAKSRSIDTSSSNFKNSGLLRLYFSNAFDKAADKIFEGISYIQLYFGTSSDKIEKNETHYSYVAEKFDDIEEITDSTGTYKLTATTYEFKLRWSYFGYENFESVDTERVYFLPRYFYNAISSTYYWNYALPCNTTLLNRYPFTEIYGASLTAIPHVLELEETKPDAKYTNKPVLTIKDEFTKEDGNYKATFDYALTANGAVAETGILYTNSANTVKKNLVLTDSSTKHTFELSGGKASINHNFSTENYDTFVTFRPYVKYSDGTIIYGDYTTTSPNYMANSAFTFDREVNVLMIGCSFNYYYLDELVSIGAADGVKINANKAYYSGNPANATWNWLIHDSATWQEFRHDYKTPSGTKIEARTLKEILEGGPNQLTWDFISVQDHYSPTYSSSYEKCLNKSLPYLANTFRYLEATEPQATLLLHETWSYDANHKDMIKLNATLDTVNAHQKNITDAIYYMSENIPASGTIANYKGMPIVPDGAAWSYARNGLEIDGTTYKVEASSTGILTKDFYHDGETPGGQYLNACVWYEVLTGNTCIGNTWRPPYALDESRALALQKIAHKAVADLYGADYATNVPDIRK